MALVRGANRVPTNHIVGEKAIALLRSGWTVSSRQWNDGFVTSVVFLVWNYNLDHVLNRRCRQRGRDKWDVLWDKHVT